MKKAILMMAILLMSISSGFGQSEFDDVVKTSKFKTGAAKQYLFRKLPQTTGEQSSHVKLQSIQLIANSTGNITPPRFIYKGTVDSLNFVESSDTFTALIGGASLSSVSPNDGGQFYVSQSVNTNLSRMLRSINNVVSPMYEIRFGTDNVGLAYDRFVTQAIYRVPFTAWDLNGTPGNTSDDIQMIVAILRTNADSTTSWGIRNEAASPWAPNPAQQSDWIYLIYPRTPFAYADFEAAYAAQIAAGRIDVNLDQRLAGAEILARITVNSLDANPLTTINAANGLRRPRAGTIIRWNFQIQPFAPSFDVTDLYGIVGERFTFRPFVRGIPRPAISLISAPAGMTLDANSGILNWTPNSGQIGLHTIILEAVNSVGTARVTFQIVVDTFSTEPKEHNNNNTILSVFNIGVVGNEQDERGDGFFFNGQNGLFAGSIIIGQSKTQVSGFLYSNTITEFAPKSAVVSSISSISGFDQAFMASFDDSRAFSPIGVSIAQKSSSKSTSPDDDYVIMDYEISNTTPIARMGIYVGLALDWDVGRFSNNLGGYDAGRKLSYVFQPAGGTNPNYYGVAALLGQVSGHIYTAGTFNDSLVYAQMASFENAPTDTSDVRTMLSVGPYNIPAGSSVRAVFAILGGASLADLQANADAARAVPLGAAPTVTTTAATNVSSTSATLNGTVNPNGLSTTVKFQHGTTTSYGNEVTTAIITGTFFTFPVNTILSNLTPNTLYHFRLVATSSAGTSNGADQTFTTTATANRPPVVASAIPNQTLTVGGASFTRNLNVSPAVFNDPDGDALTYSANSSAMNIATASISGSMLTVAPVAAGTATITITANDGRGGAVSTTFAATVSAAPNVTTTAATNVSTNSATLNGTVNPNGLITAIKFQYGVTTSYGSEVTATPSSVAGTSSTPVSAGITGLALNTLYHYRVVGTNNAGTTNGADLTLTTLGNQLPVILHSPPSPQPGGQAIPIQANITDDSGIAGATLNYRKGGETNFTIASMTTSGGSLYQGAIPASAATSRGVEYFIAATDVSNGQTRQPGTGIFSIPIQVTNEIKPAAQNAGSAATAYRLVSVPLQLNDPAMTAVLEDDLGRYDNTMWRLFGLVAGQPLGNKTPYVELSQTGAFTPGRSFFLIVKETNKTIDAGPGQSVRTDQEFNITLEAGHNFIATPFNFDIPKSKLRLSSGGTIDLQTYAGSWVTENIKLLTWEGYYLPNNRATADILLVDPNLSSSAAAPMAEKAEAGWRIRLSAHCSEAADTHNFAGVSPASEDGWDDRDLVEAPPIGDYISLYFPHAEWRKVFERYREDIRSTGNPNQRWRFIVESNIPNAMVTLRFEGLKDIEANLAVFLVDEEMKYKQNLRENAVYQYQPRRNEQLKEFTLIAGKEEFVSDQTTNVQGVPEKFVLEQNFPNPFNPETAIRFGLPQPSVVTIKIYDLAGGEVATLLDRVELPAGRHQRLWDGRDAQGRIVVSGIYFCRMMAGSIIKTMKLMLVR